MIDTKALREKVLDLAIRGKLVPQDPNDEPASVLLERIREQKKQMVKEGKLKSKDIKGDSIIFVGDDNLHYEKFADGSVKCIEDEIPFELPDGWAWARLGNIGEIITGGTPSKSHHEYYGNAFPLFKPADLDQGRKTIISSEYLSEKGKSCCRIIPKFSTAVCCIGSIGKCGYLNVEGTTNQQINSVIPNIDSLYAYYALGYTLDPVRFSVKAKHWERSVRLAKIGFSKEVIQKQLDENAINRFRLFTLEYKSPYRPKKFPLEDELRKLEFAIDHSYDAATVLVDTIFYLVITLIQIAAELSDVMLLSPDLRAAEKDLKDLVADYHFLKENDIHTVADLQANIDESKAQLSDLERERKTLSNRIRRPKSPEDENRNKEHRKEISNQMKPVRERLRRAEKILEKSPHLYELLKQEHELERKARARYLDRSR